MNENIIDSFTFHIATHPEKQLFKFLNINGTEAESYTYNSFYHRTSTLANHFHQLKKIFPGDRVLLAYPPGLEIICAFFACVRLGLIPVPVYPPNRSDFEASLQKMSFIAEDCQASAVLTTKEYSRFFQLKIAQNRIFKGPLKRHPLSKIPWIATDIIRETNNTNFPESPGEILFLQYTSGSTSNPKGVIVSHQNILANCKLIPDDTELAVSWLPQYHDMGLIGYYIFSALKGGTTIGFSPLDFIRRPALWLETISKYKAKASSAPNFAFEYCLREDKILPKTYNRLDLSSLTFLMNAAEPVSPQTYLRFLKRFEKYGLRSDCLIAAYGLAENTLIVSNYGQKIISLNKHKLKRSIVKIEPPDLQNKHLSHLMSCGRPLKSNSVKIVNPETFKLLGEGEIGEIWVDGPSKCNGYWNKEKETKSIFYAKISNNRDLNKRYLRTGDLGFIWEKELYFCGRHKDMINFRGLNYYPQDIENILEQSSDLIRRGGVAAIGIEKEKEEALIILVEVKRTKELPQTEYLAGIVRNHCQINPYQICLIPPKTLPKTSSGKISRSQSKYLFLEKKLPVISTEKFFSQHLGSKKLLNDTLKTLVIRYGLKGNEEICLLDVGIDSIELVEIIGEIEVKLKEKGVHIPSGRIDVRLLQKLTIADLFQLFQILEENKHSENKIIQRMFLSHADSNKLTNEKEAMRRDIQFESHTITMGNYERAEGKDILLTGATGFLGPFLLANLLSQTNKIIYVLIRALHPSLALTRISEALKKVNLFSPEIETEFANRVQPICGDLSLPQLGLNNQDWEMLSYEIGAIYHNGAYVNYLLNYQELRAANVLGTKSLLTLASKNSLKIFNHISTTFIFGWTVKGLLFEEDRNETMANLDFGYSQTKWVSEQLIHQAMSKGLKARIFRPALISPAISGNGINIDISIRLLAFIINHRLGVIAKNQLSLTPVDITAHNAIVISKQAETVGNTFHITSDKYYNILDVTNMITNLTGLDFNYLEIPEFISELTTKCTSKDILFPLKNFFIRSADQLRAMELKRYDNQNYQYARLLYSETKPDPSLENIVRGIVIYMNNLGIIDVKLKVVFTDTKKVE